MGEKKMIDFIGKRKYGYLFSGFIVGCSILLLLTRGLNYGIDFKGGSLFQVRFKDPKVDENMIRKALLSNPKLSQVIGEVVVQRVTPPLNVKMEGKKAEAPNEFIIHTDFQETSEKEDWEGTFLNTLRTLGEFEKLRTERIGPTIGKIMKRKALWAIIVSIIGILVYISFRFETAFAVAAVIALVHDCLTVLGVFSLSQYEVNIGIMAALLTILGYSLNDTIVILDRIRENMRLKRNMPFPELVNLSINQSLSRTINTSVTTLLPVLSLLLLAGVVIRNFALALLIGVVVGTYSSIFIVSPLLVSRRLYKSAKKA